MLDKFHPYISFAGNNHFNHRTLFSFDRVKLWMILLLHVTVYRWTCSSILCLKTARWWQIHSLQSSPSVTTPTSWEPVGLLLGGHHWLTLHHSLLGRCWHVSGGRGLKIQNPHTDSPKHTCRMITEIHVVLLSIKKSGRYVKWLVRGYMEINNLQLQNLAL